LILTTVLSLVWLAGGCGQPATGPAQGGAKPQTITVTDQLGRQVELPAKIEKVAAFHHFGAKLIYAMGQQDKLVHQALLGVEAKAMAKVDPKFAALPNLEAEGHDVNIESVVALGPQVAFVYSSFDQKELEALENAGIKVIGLRGETLEESYEAARLVGKVLGCEDKAEAYIKYCQDLVKMVRDRLADLPADQRPKVLCAGPKSIFTAATGEMLQSTMIELAGGKNVAAELKGFWASVSPEQIVQWNPDYILLGSSLGKVSVGDALKNPGLQTVKAVKEGKIYAIPSNIGWWDFPAPQCVLGIVWMAKTLHPDRFRDVDLTKMADDYYSRFCGYSFTALGGKL
jgi:iron complex transport system substrate-binding protein